MSGLFLRWRTFGKHHPRAVDLTADPIGRVPLRRRQEVTVGPQRDRRVGVAQPRGATTCSGTPASKANVADVRPRWCSRMLGNPVAATVRVNRPVGTAPNARA
jgi:hypothetical protein